MARKQGNETDVIHAPWWDEDETVTIRRHLMHGMQKAIQQAYAASADRSAIIPGDPTSIKIDPVKALEGVEASRLRWIVSWTLKDASGGLLPLEQASIDTLVEEDIDFIDAEIEKRSGGMTEEEKKVSSTTQSAGTGD